MVMTMPGITREGFEKVASDNADTMREITQRSKEQGAIHHAFCESESGEMFVVDEWDSPESFKKFFESEAPNIGPLMEAGGATGAPQQTFYEKLDSADAF